VAWAPAAEKSSVVASAMAVMVRMSFDLLPFVSARRGPRFEGLDARRPRKVKKAGEGDFGTWRDPPARFQFSRTSRKDRRVIYLLAAGAGIVAAVVGWFVSGAVAVWMAGLFGVSDFEGARGMFGFLAVGPIGGLAGMIGAVWLVLRRGRGPAPIGAMLGRVGLVLAGIVALVDAAIGVRFLTLDTYT